MMNDSHISDEQLALYAIRALSDRESAEVRQHVSGCGDCREQLASIEGELALVAISVEQHAVPEGARQRFVERIASAPAPGFEPYRAPAIPMVAGKQRARSWIWIPWTAVAAMLILSAGLSLKSFFLKQQLDTEDALLRREERLFQKQNAENTRARMLLEALTAPTAQRITLTTGKAPPAPSARAIYLPSRGALILQASNMQPLPPNKTYELWVIPASGTPIPAGTFHPDAAGSGSVVLPQIPQGVQAKMFGITVENVGGSSTPTMPIVLSGTAAAAGE